jgi:site-specific DNA-methyltransferase (adenine-specific)
MRVEFFIKHYRGLPFHAMLCDPPYHLDSIVKRFGGTNSKPSRDGDVYTRSSAGFMGKKWDGGDIAFRPETWAGLTRPLYPGGFIFSFASTRGWHRQAVAMEDAGLIMHPSIAWMFGSGFPKATRIDTQIDKVAGAEREVINSDLPQFGINKTRVEQGHRPNFVANGKITKPATPLAQTWAGHRYGRQALKPSFEPILVFQKPYSGRPVDDIVATGAGALNIDAARIPTSEAWQGSNIQSATSVALSGGVDGTLNRSVSDTHPGGRWPSNVILQHSPECTADSCAEGCACEALGRQSDKHGLGRSDWVRSRRDFSGWISKGELKPKTKPLFADDDGTAARFYQQSHWANEVAEQIAGSDGFCYQAKASRSERDAGIGSVTSGEELSGGGESRHPKADAYQARKTDRRNTHATVKPLSLTAYLAKLLLPPDDYAPRRILIPFAGSGSEMIGAFQAGFEEIVGIEMMSEYRELALARIAYWTRRGVQMELF